MKNKIQKNQERSAAMVLGYLISSAEEALNLLCRMNFENKTYLKNPLLRKGRKDNLSFRDYAVCISALKSHLSTLIFRMFDKEKRNGKRIISFKTVEWFSKQPKIKGAIDEIHGEKIIKEIIKTRHTFIGHVALEVQNIISVDEICKSNLRELLERLNGIYNFWLLDGK